MSYATRSLAFSPHAFATAAIVLALVGLAVPGAGMFAILFAVVALWRSKRRGFVPLRRVTIAIVLGTISTIAYGIVGARIVERHLETMNRIVCANNFKQIGQAIMLYQNDHRTRLPARFEQLQAYGLPPAAFVCPSAHSAGTKAVEDEIAARAERRLSYVMVEPVKGKFDSQYRAEDPNIFEPLANHDGEGAHILFMDGHTEFVSRDLYLMLLEPFRNNRGLTDEEYAFLVNR